MAIVISDITANYLKEIKTSVRVVSDSFNDEIKSIIMSARFDLALAGISNEKINNERDYLIKNAIINYVRSEFGLNNKESEKYRKSYDLLREKMSLSQEYTSS